MDNGISEMNCLTNDELEQVSGGLANFAFGAAIGMIGYGAYSFCCNR